MEVGEKCIFYSKRGHCLRYGKISDKYTFKNSWDKEHIWYRLEGENVLIDDNLIKRCEFGDEEIETVSKNYHWKRYRYLVLKAGKDGLELRLVKTKGMSALEQFAFGIYEMNKELFKSSSDEEKLYILEKYWDSELKKFSSRFNALYFYPSQGKFSVSIKDFAKVGIGENEVIKIGDDLDRINEKVGKDIGYLIGELYMRDNRWKGFLRNGHGKILEEYVKKHNLEEYMQAKKDLMSDGDEVWGKES